MTAKQPKQPKPKPFVVASRWALIGPDGARFGLYSTAKDAAKEAKRINGLANLWLDRQLASLQKVRDFFEHKALDLEALHERLALPAAMIGVPSAHVLQDAKQIVDSGTETTAVDAEAADLVRAATAAAKDLKAGKELYFALLVLRPDAEHTTLDTEFMVKVRGADADTYATVTETLAALAVACRLWQERAFAAERKAASVKALANA